MPSASMSTPSATSDVPKFCGARLVSAITFDSRRCENAWKIVKPKPISDSAVRMIDISVRSALMRARWNDMPVRREESSTETWSASSSARRRAMSGPSVFFSVIDVFMRELRGELEGWGGTAVPGALERDHTRDRRRPRRTRPLQLASGATAAHARPTSACGRPRNIDGANPHKLASYFYVAHRPAACRSSVLLLKAIADNYASGPFP